MKYLRLTSDNHLDFDIDTFKRSRGKLLPEIRAAGEMAFLWLPPPMLEDLDTTMIVAGDIWTQKKFLTRKYNDGDSWMGKLSNQFKYVIFVLGNHDYWGANLSDEPLKVKQELANQKLTNVFLLERDTIIIDNIKFVGATLWTDFNKHDLGVMMDAPNLMNDYKKIRYGGSYKKVNASNICQNHNESKSYIFSHALKDSIEQKLVVVTHMPPSIQSLEERYRLNHKNINHLYYSDLEKEIQKTEIDFWMHGHTHNLSNYKIGSTRVLANPRGYVSEQSTGFDPNFRLKL